MALPDRLHLFCHVIDNLGDAGVCWRLARQLAHEHSVVVTLWLDDLASLKKICPELDVEADCQIVGDVSVRRWPSASEVFAPDDVADAVIEAFGCELPSAYVAAMAARQRTPAWVNLEYLSAEAWVEGCHTLPSHHPSLPLTKYFFFPGFTEATGGLLRERDLFERRDAFQRDPAAMTAFLARLGVNVPAGARTVSLFCYPFAPADALFAALQADIRPVLCLVPEGVAAEAVNAFLQQPAKAGTSATRGALTLQVLPFVPQDDYDRLLWACDLNFVRGEDSFVRAQWAARPFVWHIYPQDQVVHLNKLGAFLERFTAPMAPDVARAASGFWQTWNATTTDALAADWHNFCQVMPQLSCRGRAWAQELLQHEDLASSLVRFLQKIG